MRRRQCKICNKMNEHLYGVVIKKKVMPNAVLPGLDWPSDVRVYTVECSKCGRKWTYRKKAGKN